MPAKRGPKHMTQAHKDALDRGRREGRAVRDYIQALNRVVKKRGRQPVYQTPEQLELLIESAEDVQDRMRLRVKYRQAVEREARTNPAVDMEALEAEFVKVVKSYSERLGISAADWRAEGVSAEVLRKAGYRLRGKPGAR